jgi:putative restriction enzyme alpha subunit
MINNEAQLANTLETLLRLGVDYFGILSHYDRILVALSALYTYSDKMRKCVTVDDLLAHISERCDIDSVSDALQSITTNKGKESRGVNDYVGHVAEIVHFARSAGEVYDFAGILYRMHATMVGKSNAGQVMTPPHITRLMVRLLNITADDVVMDTTCGCGTLLLTTAGMTGCKVAGVEYFDQMYNIAIINMAVNGIDFTQIRSGDATTEGIGKYISEVAPSVLLLNPPYETKNGCMEIVKSALDNAPKGARVAIILPDTKLDKQRGHKLLRDHTLSTIVKLPPEVFAAFVDTSIFIFEPNVPQCDTKINAFKIDDDGHQTIKKRGRIDIENKWANDYEDYWVNAVKSNIDQRYNTHRVVDPAVRLSYPPKERETIVTQDDYMRTAVNYYISTTDGVTVGDLRDMLRDELDGMLYGLSGGDDNEQN